MDTTKGCPNLRTGTNLSLVCQQSLHVVILPVMTRPLRPEMLGWRAVLSVGVHFHLLLEIRLAIPCCSVADS
jgi:hypothetical protein